MAKEITRGELVRDYADPTPLITREDAAESAHVIVRDARRRALAIQPLGRLVYRLDDARFEQYWPHEPDPLRRFSLHDTLLCESPAVADHVAMVLFALSVRRGMLELFDDGIETGYTVPLGGYGPLFQQMQLRGTNNQGLARVHPAAVQFTQRFLRRMPRTAAEIQQYKAILEANAHVV